MLGNRHIALPILVVGIVTNFVMSSCMVSFYRVWYPTMCQRLFGVYKLADSVIIPLTLEPHIDVSLLVPGRPNCALYSLWPQVRKGSFGDARQLGVGRPELNAGASQFVHV